VRDWLLMPSVVIISHDLCAGLIWSDEWHAAASVVVLVYSGSSGRDGLGPLVVVGRLKVHGYGIIN